MRIAALDSFASRRIGRRARRAVIVGLAVVAVVLASGATVFGQVFSVPDGVIENGRFEEVELGVIEITYDLVSSAPSATFSIELFVSEDGGQTFVQATTVSGDVGSGVTSGRGKRIVWRWTEDIESLSPQIDLFEFQVRTESAPLSPPPGAQVEPPDGGGINPLVWVAIAGGGAGAALAATGGGDDPVIPPPVTTTCIFSLSLHGLTFDAQGGSSQVNVAVENSPCSPTSWSASSNVSWIMVQPTSGDGFGMVTLTIDPNTSGSPRNGTVTIANQTLPVQQGGASACEFEVTPRNLNVGSSAQNRTLSVRQVETNCDDTSWTASSDVSWISLNPTSGNGNGSVTATIDANVEPNESSPARTGTLSIAGQTVTLQQSANVCNFNVQHLDDPNDNGAVGGGVTSRRFQVTVVSTCAWTGETSEPWLRFRGGSLISGTGNSGVRWVDFDRNTGPPRLGTVTLGPRTFELCQVREGTPGPVSRANCP